MEETTRDEEASPYTDLVSTVRELQGKMHGIAATLMPVGDGWRLKYFSNPTFENEPGADFSNFEDALDALAVALPVINSPEERARSHTELIEYLRKISERESEKRAKR